MREMGSLGEKSTLFLKSVNPQATPKDKNAALVIHARVDEVIREVMNELHLQIPPYVRVDCVTVSYYYAMTRKKSVKWVLRIASTHGHKAPLPFLESVEVTFPERPDLKNAIWSEQPFLLRRVTSKVKALDVLLTLKFGNGSMCSTAQIRHTLHFEPNEVNRLEGDREASLETLRVRAALDTLCGQVSPIEIRQPTDGSKGSVVDFGIVTCVVSHTPNNNLQSPAKRLPEEMKVEGEETEDRTGEAAGNGGRKAEERPNAEEKIPANAGNGIPKAEEWPEPQDKVPLNAQNGGGKAEKIEETEKEMRANATNGERQVLKDGEELEDDNIKVYTGNGARKRSRKS